MVKIYLQKELKNRMDGREFMIVDFDFDALSDCLKNTSKYLYVFDGDTKYLLNKSMIIAVEEI